MSSSFINKVITAVHPIITSPASPVMWVKKIANKEKTRIKLGGNGMPEHIYLTAHRGVTSVAPENTIPAYQEAVRLGYYSAECDIVLTKDNKWVLSHNDKMDIRLWQVGNISDTTLEELRKYKHKNGSNFWAYKDLKVPTLEEYLDVFVGSETRPQIEIKGDNIDRLKEVLKAVYDRGLEKQSIIISFNLDQLKTIRSLDSEIELWYLIDRINEKHIEEVKSLGNAWFSPYLGSNDAESIQLAIDNGVKCSFWTVNTIEEAKMLYDLGIRHMETDILCY